MAKRKKKKYRKTPWMCTLGSGAKASPKSKPRQEQHLVHRLELNLARFRTHILQPAHAKVLAQT